MIVRLRHLDYRGFSLVETLAAILIFAIVTLGLTPLIITSLRGSDLSRSYTVGKNAVVQAMERVRGLPFYRQVSSAGVPQRVDVLDLYFPRGFGTGNTAAQSFASNTFTTVCTPTTDPATVPGCGGISIPPNYTITFQAQFVSQCAAADTSACTAVDAGDLERYETASVSSNYYWQGTAATPGPACPTPPCTDRPVSGAVLRMTIRADWTRAGDPQSFELTSLISDRKFGGPRIDATATIDHVVQFVTGFDDGGQTSTLTATGGISRTRIDVGAVGSAEHSGRAGRLLLEDSSLPEIADEDLSGATSVADAPPDVASPTNDDSEIAQIVNHVDRANQTVAGIDSSTTSNVEAAVVIDVPQAGGDLNLVPSVATLLGLVWVDAQVEPSDNPLRLCDPTLAGCTDTDSARVAWVTNSLEGDDGALGGHTEASSTDALPPAGETVANASASFTALRFFPTDFVDPAAGTERAVIEISNYQASVTCAPTGTLATATSSSSGSYSGNVRYWVEADPDNGVAAGGYVSPFSITADNTLSELADDNAPAAEDTPMVWEEPNAPVTNLTPQEQGRAPEDIYLFPVTRTYDVADIEDEDGDEDVTELTVEVTKDHAGYLVNWTSLGATVPVEVEPAAEGRLVEVAMSPTFSLTSVPLDPTANGTGSFLAASVGNLSCTASDFR